MPDSIDSETRNMYVTLTVEGDIWNYEAVAETVMSAGRDFLRRFYVPDKDHPDAETMLEQLGAHIRNPVPLNADYTLATGRMHVHFEFENEWYLMNGDELVSGDDLCYNNEEGGLISSLDRKKYAGPIKIYNYPVLKLRTNPWKTRGSVEAIEKRLERFVQKLRENLFLTVNVMDERGRLVLNEEIIKAHMPQEYWSIVPNLLAAQHDTPRLWYDVHFEPEYFHLGRGDVSIELAKISASYDYMKEDE